MTSTTASSEDGPSSVRRLALRDEVLEICYWFQGEGFGDRFTAQSLKTFLNDPSEAIEEALTCLATRGALVKDGQSYQFSPAGKKQAGRLFHDSFTDFQLGTHGECTAGCCESENDKPQEAPHKNTSTARS